jgi:hypothetical protein
VKASLQEWLGVGIDPRTKAPRIRKSGQLEEVRAIKKFPDHVMLDGKPVAVFHTDPYIIMSRALDLQARRTAFVEAFGSGEKVSNVSNKTLRNLASTLGLKVGLTKEQLIERATEAGVPPEKLVGVTWNSLRKLLKDAGTTSGLSREEYLSQIESLNAQNFTKPQRRKIVELARKLKGIPLNDDFFNIYNNVLARAKSPVRDLVSELRTQYAAEGGDVRHFDDALRVWQGIPHPWALNRNRGVRFTSDVIGAMQTSLSVAPNITQTVMQVPRYVGIMRFGKAVVDVMHDPQLTTSQLVSLGAFNRQIVDWSFERGAALENTGRMIRQVMGTVTGLRFVSERNNLIAAQGFKLMADDWREYGVPKSDLRVLSDLSLTKAEIADASSGKAMSDRTYRKIIQNGVALTQFITEAPHRKARIENIPFLRILFAYSNYTFGTTRANIKALGDLRSAVAAKDLSAVGGALRRSWLLLAGSAGAGIGASVLREALKGQLTAPPENDEWYDRALAGMTEVQLLGATQRMIDPFHYDGGVIERAAIGVMPQVRAVMNFFGAMIGGYGKFGKFGMGTRLRENIKSNFPLLKALGDPTFIADPSWGWIDRAAYPDQDAYFSARSEAGSWIKANRPRERFVFEAQISPDYWSVYQFVLRNDVSSARDVAIEVYKSNASEGTPVEITRRRLRSSLLARSPINLNLDDTHRFLATLPTDQRIKVWSAEARYNRIVDAIAPTSQH